MHNNRYGYGVEHLFVLEFMVRKKGGNVMFNKTGTGTVKKTRFFEIKNGNVSPPVPVLRALA